MPVERITKEQLKERLDRGQAPTILDVRLKYAYEHSTVKLPGAIRVPPYALDSVSIPTTGEIVIVTKGGSPGVYRFPAVLAAGVPARSSSTPCGRSARTDYTPRNRALLHSRTMLSHYVSVVALIVSVSLQAAYSAAATKAEIDLPLTSPFSSAFL